MTDTAAHADVILPATTQLEHLDVVWSWGHHYLTLNEPAIAPVGEARSNSEIFRLLAHRLGLTDPCFDESDEEMLATALEGDPAGISLAGPARARLREDRPRTGRDARTPRAASQRRRASSSCAASGWPRPGSIRCRSTTRPARSPTSELAERYPAGAADAQDAPLPELHVRERPPPARRAARAVRRHPPRRRRAARHRGRRDRARRTTTAGASRAARSSRTTRAQGVPVAPMGWWNRDYAGGHSPQATTPQRLTTLRDAPTFNDNRVEIARAGRHVIEDERQCVKRDRSSAACRRRSSSSRCSSGRQSSSHRHVSPRTPA